MEERESRALVLRPGEGRSVDLGSLRMSVKATHDETGGAFSLLETDEAPDFATTLHIHHDAAEAFYVLQGEYTIFVEGRQFVCSAGSFIFIPAGVPHGFRVSTTRSRKLNLYAPAAMVGYFDDLSEAVKQGTVDPVHRSEIAARHAMEVLGPVPEGHA